MPSCGIIMRKNPAVLSNGQIYKQTAAEIGQKFRLHREKNCGKIYESASVSGMVGRGGIR